MPVILTLDTKPSLFEPNEIKIDGHKFTIKELTLEGVEKLQALQPDLQAGSATAIRKILELMLDGKLDLLKKLQMSKLRKLIDTLMARAINPTGEEKNAPGPGDGSSL